MVNSASLAADPAWLPHRIDISAGQVLFLRLPRELTAAHGFLAELEGKVEQTWMPLDDYATLECGGSAVHFVFHTGLCCSTLLIRALNIPGICAGLNEPGILNSLVQIGPRAEHLIRPTLELLSRPHARGEITVVKPSNYVNSMAGALLSSRTQSRAVMMTDALPVFLSRLVRRGLTGRVWGRQVLLEALKVAESDLAIHPDSLVSMSDLQAAALGWFIMQRSFTKILGAERDGKARSLHGERFRDSPAEGLLAIARFFDLKIDRSQAEAIATTASVGAPAGISGNRALRNSMNE